jgi:hypothetical protein
VLGKRKLELQAPGALSYFVGACAFGSSACHRLVTETLPPSQYHVDLLVHYALSTLMIASVLVQPGLSAQFTQQVKVPHKPRFDIEAECWMKFKLLRVA